LLKGVRNFKRKQKRTWVTFSGGTDGNAHYSRSFGVNRDKKNQSKRKGKKNSIERAV